MRKILNTLFGIEFILYRYGGYDKISRVRLFPNNKKYVRCCAQYLTLGDDGTFANDIGKYVYITKDK